MTLPAIVGLLVLGCIIALLITKKVSVHLALSVPPIIGALILGIGITEIGSLAASGVSKIASTGVMLMFAVLFFGVLFDAGMFDPIINFVIKAAGGDPAKIALGTAVIATIVHLDGSGAITFLITCSAMLPVYRALKMNPLVLALCAGLPAGVMNLVPWGGPTIRVATALSMDANEVFMPMLPWIMIGLACAYITAWFLGVSERKRVGIHKNYAIEAAAEQDPEKEALKRPKMMIPNVILCLGSIVVMLTKLLSINVVFVLFTPIALLLNYPNPKDQQKRIQALAPSALYTATVIFVAGVFTGIFSGSGMLEALAAAITSLIPETLGGMLTPILALISPLTSLGLDPDTLYYGVMPVFATAAQGMGVNAVQVGHAMLAGQHIFACCPMTGSAWLLCSLCNIEMGDLQKRMIPIGFGITILFVISGKLLGII